MGKKYFSEEDILKLKEAEKGGGGGASFLVIVGLGLIVAGLLYASHMQGKTLTPVVTPFAIGVETAVSQLATPTLAPTATATASATWLPTETATAIPTHTPLPTQTPYPTYTPYPSATWTAQPTFTPQATWTPEPTHTALPTYTPYPSPTATSTAVPTAVPLATNAPLLPLPVNQADPPDGDGPLALTVILLIGSLIVLALAALLVLAYVSHQMRPPTPVMVTPEGVPVDTAPNGRKFPPPAGPPVRQPRPAPVQAPVTPVTPPGATSGAPVQTGQGAPPETIAVSVTDANPDTDEATMRALCTAWNEIAERGEQPSLNKLCIEYFGGKNSERMAIARRAVRWGRAKGLIGNPNKKEVKRDVPTIPDPKPTQTTNGRRSIPILTKRGPGVLN